ncbi:glycosyltransferase [Gemmatimonas groenlandica]|uniref:Glycosyltransferase n=1 Tax=Gemmatimonas groenlandica TaxID=2732249 RepID=A0A6M4IM03_9BACT|nr:glycosyltransferase [Gemmatimonas groenlandica]QJR35085.1 glycosyltransferase [Gemmatimonas groenlandica]
MPRAARVLFVTHNVPRFDGDAAGSFVLRLAVALQSAGATVDIIAPGAAGLADDGTLEGVRIRRVRYASDARMTLAYAGNMAEQVMASWGGKMALLGMLRALRRAVRAQLDAAARAGAPYDIVHAHWWFPSALALWHARRAGDPPLVITMHGSDVRLAQRTAPAHPVMRAVLGQAAMCTAVSGWLADTARRIAPDATIAVSPMPVDARHFAPPADSSSARSGILFVGRLNAQKGLADLLDAMISPAMRAYDAQRDSEPTTLDVVGDGPEADALKARAAALGLADRVRWYGALPQPALVPLYQGACALAIPSREEGLGLVAVEAQLCGTPVVAYADGGLLDVVRPEHGGTLVTVGDSQALGVALARLLADETTARTLGMSARHQMLERFSPASVADRYLTLYRQAAR